ncbi:MAG: NnrU family protein [Ferrovibrio sp.]|uniref:NnrU family protein n=1 Tax=Ferrovibrio sp. TaxID=1917215 RepID=UPI0026179AAA|nr:NnrU family protein [Ferrovibrio sp.]MCW0233239.1 NnrU family protein [Ferrovibrio sp.]
MPASDTTLAALAPLAIAALAWVLLHGLVAGRLRPLLVARLGLPAYRGLFSIMSAVFLGLLIWTYSKAPYVEVWPATSALAMVPLMVMPVACLLLVGSLRPSNPTSAGPDMLAQAKDKELPVRGFTKITRHPMLWAFSLWAGSHMIANGDLAHWLLAGAILLTALNGMLSIDSKRAAQFGERWQRFTEKTSIIPLVAVAQGRVRLQWKDIGILNIIAAAVIYGAFLWGHAILFGVPAFHP